MVGHRRERTEGNEDAEEEEEGEAVSCRHENISRKNLGAFEELKDGLDEQGRSDREGGERPRVGKWPGPTTDLEGALDGDEHGLKKEERAANEGDWPLPQGHED